MIKINSTLCKEHDDDAESHAEDCSNNEERTCDNNNNDTSMDKESPKAIFGGDDEDRIQSCGSDVPNEQMKRKWKWKRPSNKQGTNVPDDVKLQ